ncbi:MAG: alpha-galactosidase [Clostridia bacterium]|nr:alpha-galactosidase [Clostridia bacterium]
MNINFGHLRFGIENERIYLIGIGQTDFVDRGPFCEVQIAGEIKDSHLGIKMIKSSEGKKLRYVAHTQTQNELEIVQQSELVRTVTTFSIHDDSNGVQIRTRVTNLSCEPIVLEEVSAFVLAGFAPIAKTAQLQFTRFAQSHHTECQPMTHTLHELGLFAHLGQRQERVSFSNVGAWSTKEALPQGILTDADTQNSLLFQIESSNSWYYEIGTMGASLYLYLGGANASHGAWSKCLQHGESYETVSVSLAFGQGLDDLLANATRHRRHIAGKCAPDTDLPSIFNEYMHLSWDSPSADATRKYAPVISRLGVKYYVIDCGWHNEEDGNIIYPYVGHWKESQKRFPLGVRETTDYIRSLGMKAGLWIEPEIIGCKCAEMLDFYGDDCFLQRHGKRICTMNRYFLDYRHPKVIAYMTEAIRRMVEDYGADYIKMDFNQDCGVGTDRDALTPGEGLESHARAYLAWIDAIRARFPDVLFETCSSGGMRMDYGTLSHFSIVSTSDQTSYRHYPYIAGNVLAAVIPEQAAVWSYPVGTDTPGFTATREWVNEHIPDEQIIMNMINSFLGRIHLASHLELLDERKLELIADGIRFYDAIIPFKKTAIPCMPLGLTNFGKTLVASGLRNDKTLLLAIWNLGGEKQVEIPLGAYAPKSVRIVYPTAAKYAIPCLLDKDVLHIEFSQDIQARMLEILL